jgi:hypothetical protein
MNNINYLPNDIMQYIMDIRRQEMKNDLYRNNYNKFVKSFNRAVDIYISADLFECDDRIIHIFGREILYKYKKLDNYTIENLREFMENEGIGIEECLNDEPLNDIDLYIDDIYGSSLSSF